MKFRKLLRIFHRDFGYFIVGMTFVYVFSGIILNHRHDFNPDYRIYTEEFTFDPNAKDATTEPTIISILNELSYPVKFKKHYINKEGLVKVFIENGEVVINPKTGEGTLQYLERRPLIFGMNKLHKATLGTTWKWVSDIMSLILLLVAVSGLFLLKGKRGFIRWGWWWMVTGFVVPLVFALLFV